MWGREWDALLHADRDGALVNLMNTTPDGDYQTYKANDGGYVRDHFFGRDPRTKALVENMSDQDIWNLKRAATITARFTPPTAPPSTTRDSRR